MDAKSSALLGAVLVSIMGCLAFLVALATAYLSKDQVNLAMLLGVVAGGFNQIMGFWIGSSMGSQKKDDLLARSVPAARAERPGLCDAEIDKLADALIAKTEPPPPPGRSFPPAATP